ncbi:hypothetical protein GB937_001831 [Aspergillus fischeri]|nr:hypothetical protein GB937_001831 [Aspergillus fischeri]
MTIWNSFMDNRIAFRAIASQSTSIHVNIDWKPQSRTMDSEPPLCGRDPCHKNSKDDIVTLQVWIRWAKTAMTYLIYSGVFAAKSPGV